MVNEGQKAAATAHHPVASDTGVIAELLDGGVRSEFGLLYAGDQHMVAVKEVLQFCVAVLYAIAIELEKSTPRQG